MKPFLKQIIQHNFAHEHIKYAFGYGSAVFKQANYNQDAPSQVIDMIFVVDDAHQFHSKNFKMNYKHYSGWSKRLPLSVTTSFVQRTGSCIYFHPLIPISTFTSPETNFKSDRRRFKYGIIQMDDAITDLHNWDRFALAGRMQKPVLEVVDEAGGQMERAVEANRW